MSQRNLLSDSSTFLRCLVITANIGSLFESPQLIPGWCTEVGTIIRSCKPEFLEFTFQEIGGKDSAFMKNLSEFEKLFTEKIIHSYSEKLYSSGLLFEEDLQSPNFTALASLFLLNPKALKCALVWNFEEKSWKNLSEYNKEQKFLLPISSAPFVRHFRFEGTKSRKGFLQTKWKLINLEYSFINIHMYHDDKNTSAVAKIPSEYSIKREEALAEMVRKCSLTNSEPVIVSGDYNMRLDGDVIVWLNNKFSHRHLMESSSGDLTELLKNPNPTPNPVTVEEKSFLFNYSSEVFCGPFMRPKLLKFDREIDRFNKSHTEVTLNEMDITFDPTYCFESESLQNPESSKIYATKRIPAWCDRVTFSNKMKELLKNPIYNSIYGKYCTGDHSPVFLSFGLGDLPPPIHSEINEPVFLRPHNFKLKYFKKPTFCQLCSGFIWGLTSPQGYQCSVCKYSIHKKNKCRNFVPNNCGSRLRTPTQEQIQLAEKLASEHGITELEEV